MTSSTLILRGYWDAYILEAEEYSRFWLLATKGKGGGGTVIQPFRPHFGLKIRGGAAPGAPPLDPPLQTKLPEMRFELPFNLIGKLTIAFLTGQSWQDQSRPVVKKIPLLVGNVLQISLFKFEHRAGMIYLANTFPKRLFHYQNDQSNRTVQTLVSFPGGEYLHTRSKKRFFLYTCAL